MKRIISKAGLRAWTILSVLCITAVGCKDSRIEETVGGSTSQRVALSVSRVGYAGNGTVALSSVSSTNAAANSAVGGTENALSAAAGAAASDSQTRAIANGSSASFANGDRLGLFLRGDGYDDIDNRAVVYDAANSKWNISDPIFVEYEDATVTAYYPYDDSEDFDMSAIELTPGAYNIDTNDFVWDKTTVSAYSPTASFQLQHALTRVKIRLNGGNPANDSAAYQGEGTVMALQIADDVDLDADERVICYDATIDLTQDVPVITPGVKGSVLDMTNKSLKDGTVVYDLLLVPVSNISAGSVMLNVVIDDHLVSSAFPVGTIDKWEAGKSYTYDVSVRNGEAQIVFGKAYTTPWNDGGTVSGELYRPIDVGKFWLEETDPSGMMTWAEAISYCSGLGNGWRLPTQNELMYLYGINPGLTSIDKAFLNDEYWTATESPTNTSKAWYVEFVNSDDYYGYVNNYTKTITANVRCVRDKEASERSNYPYVTTENSGVIVVLKDDDGGVDDSNLFPSRVTKTKTGNAFSSDNRMSRKFRVQKGQSETKTWSDAVSYCDNLTEEGYSDWRVPSQRELMLVWSLGGSSTYTTGEKNHTGVGSSPIAFTTSYLYQQSGFTAFSGRYWTATQNVHNGNSDFAWHVWFDAGHSINYETTHSINVRCVRDEWIDPSVSIASATVAPDCGTIPAEGETYALTLTVTGTLPADGIEVRAVSGSDVLASGAVTVSGTAVSLTIPENETSAARTVDFQYQFNGKWVTIKSGAQQSNYGISSASFTPDPTLGMDAGFTTYTIELNGLWDGEVPVRAYSDNTELISNKVVYNSTDNGGSANLLVPANNSNAVRNVKFQYQFDEKWETITSGTQPVIPTIIQTPGVDFEIYNSYTESRIPCAEAVEYCKSKGDGWRLPTQNELMYIWCILPSLSDLDGNELYTGQYSYYWCATDIGISGYYKTVCLLDGLVSDDVGDAYARCVRDRQVPEHLKYPYISNASDGGVVIVLKDDNGGIDERSLYSERITETIMNNVKSYDENCMSRKFRVQKAQNTTEADWNNRVSYCDNLEEEGYSDWRVPSQRELMLLWLFGGNSICSSGDINNTGVGDSPIAFTSSYLYQQSGFTAFNDYVYYWTSSHNDFGLGPYQKWYVNFSRGNTYYYSSNARSLLVRCIRDEW